jgi:hypothetical protein
MATFSKSCQVILAINNGRTTSQTAMEPMGMETNTRSPVRLCGNEPEPYPPPWIGGWIPAEKGHTKLSSRRERTDWKRDRESDYTLSIGRRSSPYHLSDSTHPRAVRVSPTRVREHLEANSGRRALQQPRRCVRKRCEHPFIRSRRMRELHSNCHDSPHSFLTRVNQSAR